MLTDKDIDKLTSVLATKNDLKELVEDVSSLKEVVQGLTTAVDGLAKVIDDLRIEYSAIKMQLSRHEEWIKEIAKKTGVKLKF
ncbi:MAG: hypothetical protein A3H57_02485 [Candidatus Taylorbacteria bacterium RIFCSPLOWO2_02_FULL_43_11]|uniref:Uncharacterized protein n=1 Tax=Candidatus Taylorbacteria bacterium RIFCSPHIGHO2_02_FULL_43_32b TaxID=1802306 RepID=A0A1G2MFV1_9BACT|nr:MAG: hypothetical protein A2743_00240 [Candidatus Taylorbacteria bacterium RIFCSPHIGHO2_01_FULL_43_47]OHA22795.1 MAG: hypothetical protein A3C72_02680 [Candidatus Taylorbacteria bacterium RIFCSPHIGHO2_02_FULL_43_32b]OHA30851.1 MAG: hypothetical protein A3B08_01495 [Candidatus Taylorbacteria bacterium RIFCSPLOWO2_01_FULL_43_44]OHA35246.1 MAG: hypothetical protein A3H57_02485 [Candidatus Taylorbacteria bacterium RIFCSPLOWO2_02_FULL_43_11]